MRYSQILSIVSELKPKIILEIGTHKANRPIEWRAVCNFKYIGFDLFESGTPELNKKEGNTKGMCSKKFAMNKLSMHDIDNELYEGLSADTVPLFNKNNTDIQINFAFIDGGHSAQTILLDLQNVKPLMAPNGVIILDDYYTQHKNINHMGCNMAVKKVKHTLLPPTDLFPYMDDVLGIQLVKIVC